jgi:hypothetical protein
MKELTSLITITSAGLSGTNGILALGYGLLPLTGGEADSR